MYLDLPHFNAEQRLFSVEKVLVHMQSVYEQVGVIARLVYLGMARDGVRKSATRRVGRRGGRGVKARHLRQPFARKEKRGKKTNWILELGLADTLFREGCRQCKSRSILKIQGRRSRVG